MELDRGLTLGSKGGHGVVSYQVVEYAPGSSVTFQFTPILGGISLLRGTHEFRIAAANADQVEIVHVIDCERSPLVNLIMPGHDALLEDLLDQAEATLTGKSFQRKSSPGWSAASFLESALAGAKLPTSPRRRQVALGTAAALAGIGLLHVRWGFGSSWPMATREQLARKVVGSSSVPGLGENLAVAGLIAAAVAALLSRTRNRSSRKVVRGLSAILSLGAGGVLALRGLAGWVADALGTTTPPFRRLDATIYSPLCLALAAGMFYANSRPRLIIPQEAKSAASAGGPQLIKTERRFNAGEKDV